MTPAASHTEPQFLSLHRTAGNRAVGQLLQAKLAVGAPGDVYEQEADRLADQVTTKSAHTVASGAPPTMQRLSRQSTEPMEAAPASVDHVLASPGRPLDPNVQQDMEQRFGHDFSRVRVHSGTTAEQSARDVNANAYTVGDSIVFAGGHYAPATVEGRRLIAHELTHVLQQQTAPASHAGGNIVQRDTDGSRDSGEKEAIVPFKWERDLDRADFVDRLVALLAPTRSFRGIPRDHIRASLMIPGGNFFAQYQFVFRTGQQVRLRATAWYHEDWLHVQVGIAEQPVPANAQAETQSSEIPDRRAPPKPQPTLEARAVGLVIQKERETYTVWAPEAANHPDDATVFHLVRGNWIYRHPGHVPEDHSELMEFMQVSGEWGLGPYSNWHAPEVPPPSAAPHRQLSTSEEFENETGMVYPQKINKGLHDIGVQALKESNPFSLKNLPYTIAGVVVPIGAMKLITMDAGELSGLIRLEWQIDEDLVVKSELDAIGTPSAARPGPSGPTSMPRNTQVGDIIDSPKGPQRVLQIEPGKLVTEPYIEPQAAQTVSPPLEPGKLVIEPYVEPQAAQMVRPNLKLARSRVPEVIDQELVSIGPKGARYKPAPAQGVDPYQNYIAARDSAVRSAGLGSNQVPHYVESVGEGNAHLVGRVNGSISPDGTRWWRLDYSPQKGGHINWGRIEGGIVYQGSVSIAGADEATFLKLLLGHFGMLP